ncbi:mechanosensitive ion channel [Nocardioides oleivorans]|uniref:Mechanosensitive ion channel n=1 Tax=Nocardioides oleivorans TaxID=273676 RepID=A0A4Q2S0E0_9ACTN|nr:mechanosensitive ion channel family protein [Nocardioides oleivorans]RYB93764.1 mechanosensitive ion channel [Nocardioides oleivorans]
MNLTAQPWFPWVVGVIVGLPVAVLLLSELHLRLTRRGNALAGPVNRLRIWLLPLAGLYIVLTQVGERSSENNGVRVVATLVGVLAVMVALGGLNAVLFGNASDGTWRDRLPSIFVDLARLILVVTGAAIVASYVWGLNVGGLWATLGVGSIVIGLALQNAIGSVVSGLLLLFEQPFRIGDTLDVGGVTGKVVEMNWRSTHLDIGSGVQVIPNATLAGASFSNFSRPTPAHDLVLTTSFSKSDSPHDVTTTLLAVASGLPSLRPGATPTVKLVGDGAYATTIPLVSAGQASTAQSLFLTWLWYSSRRHELSLDGESFVQHPREVVVGALEKVRPTLDLTEEDIEAMALVCEVETYGSGEVMLREGRVPERFAFIVSGSVRLSAATDDAASLDVADLEVGDVVCSDALLRQRATMSSRALTNVDVLQVPLDAVDRLVASKPIVARTLNNLVAVRERQRREAFESVNTGDSLAVVVAPATRAGTDRASA